MDKALKQRLVGASVLVALAVVILPMLLGGRPDSRQEAQPIEIPQRPAELSFETRRFPIGEQAEDQPSVLPEGEAPGLEGDGANPSGADAMAPAASPETLQERLERVAAESASEVKLPAEATSQDPSAQVIDEQAIDDQAIDGRAVDEAVGEQATVASAAGAVAGAASGTGGEASGDDDAPGDAPGDAAPPAADPVAAAPEAPPPPARVEVTPDKPVAVDPAAPGGRYVVQVASFSSTANANRLAGTLRDSGLPVLMDTVDSSAGVLHRVRVGPFEQQAEADQALTRLSRQVPDVQPRIVDLRPNEAARVTEPDDPLIRWTVQVGVFSESANAEKLVFQLRDAGFRAQSQREAGSGRTIYRVLVGPEVSREDALRSRDRIEASQGIRGIVQSTD